MADDNSTTFIHFLSNPENPYVRDEYLFARVTNASYEDTWISTMHRVNNALANVSGALLCMTVIYLVLYRTPYSMRAYSRMLLMCLMADSYLILTDIWCRSRLRISNGILIASFTGVSAFFDSYKIQAFVSLPLQASAGMLTCAVLPAQFYYRYRLAKTKQVPTTAQAFGFFIVALFFALIDGLWAAPVYYYSGTCRPGYDYGQLWAHEVPIPKLVIGDLCDRRMLGYLVYTTLIIMGSYAIAIALGVRTMQLLRNDMASYSERTRALQTQFNRILIILSATPLIITTLPMSAVVLSALLRVNTGHTGELLLMAIAWIPTCNSLTNILFVTPYRRWLFRLCVRSTRIAATSDVRNSRNKAATSSVFTSALSAEQRSRSCCPAV